MFRNLEKQVCSLKWAQRLAEDGVRQDTYFQWIYDEKAEKWDVAWTSYLDFDADERHYAAFTVQDFIDIFPKLFKFARSDNEWKFYCEAFDGHLEGETNLADIFARVLLTITKNKGSKENKRLGVIYK
jgi:hypothetical protein